MTTLGFDRPLYILPFDHRGSFQTKLFGWTGALSTDQTAQVAAAKQVIYDAFRAAIRTGVPEEKAGILVSSLREAHLRVTKSPGSRMGLVNGQVSAGHELKFVATVSLNSGKHYANERPVFVAPHNPAIEQRSNRGS